MAISAVDGNAERDWVEFRDRKCYCTVSWGLCDKCVMRFSTLMMRGWQSLVACRQGDANATIHVSHTLTSLNATLMTYFIQENIMFASIIDLLYSLTWIRSGVGPQTTIWLGEMVKLMIMAYEFHKLIIIR